MSAALNVNEVMAGVDAYLKEAVDKRMVSGV
jgi:hypothetical protein